MIKKIFLLIIFLSSFSYGESLGFKDIIENSSKVKFLKVSYLSRKGDNLASIYKHFVKDDSVISSKEKMVQRTYDANPKGLNWNSLPGKKKLYIYLDIRFVDLDKIMKYNKEIGKLSKKLKKTIEKENAKVAKQSNFKGSLFYMASYGKFSQENESLAKISFLQNSPISLGGGLSFYPKRKKYSLSSSLYVSYLLAAASNLGADNISLPVEIGGNVYGEYRFTKYKLTGYGGIDFEKFTTFNLEGIQKEKKIFLDVNKVVYLTFGFSRKLQVFNYNFFTKLSFSKSIASSRTSGYAGALNTEVFSGNKVLFYIFKRWNDKYFMHSLLKYHWMSGPSNITTLRIGLGFGYLLL